MDPKTLVVDDERIFHPDYCLDDRVMSLHIQSSAEALSWMEGRIPLVELWLDHDLGGGDTTRPVALELASIAYEGDPYPVSQIYVHTANGVAATWLMGTLGKFYSVERVNPEDHGLVPYDI